ncbi:MAG: radical SAM protein [Candidatus Omnitrophota bacterium]
MKNIRVLWINTNECILFNALEKKISNRCPALVGRVAERVLSGESLEAVLASEKLEQSLRDRTAALLNYIAGNPETYRLWAPHDIHARGFYQVLVLCSASTCSLKCLYCYGNGGERSKKMMDWNLAKDSIDFFFDHTFSPGPYTLQFHGDGEPLTNFEIVKRSVEYAREVANNRGKIVLTRVSTNGMLTEKQAHWVAENFTHVTLSIDGPPDIHNHQRPKSNGEASYDTVVKTLHALEQTGALKRLNTVVTPYSVDRLEEILRHIRSISNVQEIRLLPMSFCGRCEQTAISPLDSKHYEEQFHKVMPIAAALNFKMLSVIEQANYYTQYYCGACGFNMVVAPNGNISTCHEVLSPQDPGCDELLIGRYDDQTREIRIDWSKVATLRTRTFHNLSECKQCTFRTNCAGCCLTRAARSQDTVMAVDPEACRIAKNTLTKYFNEMADGHIARPDSSIAGFTPDLQGPNPVTQLEEETKIKRRATFQEVIDSSREVIRRFDQIEPRPWTIEVTTIELMKQVGDLTKRLLMYEKYYLPHRATHPNYLTSIDAIANELADVLHSVVRIAEYYHIDLEAAHFKARREEMGYIDSFKNANTKYSKHN